MIYIYYTDDICTDCIHLSSNIYIYTSKTRGKVKSSLNICTTLVDDNTWCPDLHTYELLFDYIEISLRGATYIEIYLAAMYTRAIYSAHYILIWNRSVCESHLYFYSRLRSQCSLGKPKYKRRAYIIIYYYRIDGRETRHQCSNWKKKYMNGVNYEMCAPNKCNTYWLACKNRRGPTLLHSVQSKIAAMAAPFWVFKNTSCLDS